MAIKKSAHRNSTVPEMFYATGIAFEREAQQVSRQFLKSLSKAADKTESRK